MTYTLCPTILGAHYSVSISIPYAWVGVEAKVSVNPRLFQSIIGNRTKTVTDEANGISDIFLVPFALNWTFGDLQVNPQFFMVAPRTIKIACRHRPGGTIWCAYIDRVRKS
jgi:Putative MetA-pathway of phenol degradation